ncbi:MAG: tRNA-(ms[2]io[6]A)-hydroxylase [Deltaproteobacteria bacterium]|nr:MAG: tRNA-(ms[2]io[6]A)-hydroxylase [Deltaproteobacteria bacterium]
MLHLASETDPGWADYALAHLDEILVDHAHCEKKAASTALNLMFRYPDRSELLVPLSELAREELEHFEQALERLRERGVTFYRMTPSDYAGDLYRAIRKEEPLRLLDTLLVCSLIEARSCERMKLLSQALPEGVLKDWYVGLLASEARHHVGYVTLAEHYFPREQVKARLVELSEVEASVLTSGAAPRMHA